MTRIISLLILLVLITSGTINAQDIQGTWVFEKVPESVEMDQASRDMIRKMMQDMTMSFDGTNFQAVARGDVETGVYEKLNDTLYRITSSTGSIREVPMRINKDGFLVLGTAKQPLLLKRISGDVEIVPETNRLDRVKGFAIKEEDLMGKWNYAGRVIEDTESDLVLNHKEGVVSSLEFSDEYYFLNLAPFGMELEGIWRLEEDGATIAIENDSKTEYLKVVSLIEGNIRLYNPKNDSILIYKKVTE